MSAEALLSRLDKPKRTGPETWIARCPAHADKSPSLSVRDGGDGRVLVLCRAGCETSSVLAAVGLDFDALFPPNVLGERVPAVRKPFPAAHVLEALYEDTLFLQQLVISIQASGTASSAQRKALGQIAGRIAVARDLVNG